MEWQPLLRRPAPARRPRSLSQKRGDAAPAAPAPPEPVDVRGFDDIPRLVRQRVGHRRCDHPDYLRFVAAAFALMLDGGSKRGGRPTASAVQGLIDRWDGLAPGVTGNAKSDSQRVHAWFTHFRETRAGHDLEARTGTHLVFSHAIADARALYAAAQALRDRQWRTGSHKTVTK
jgi:hypothetical protein